MCLPRAARAQRRLEVGPGFVLALLRMRCDPQTAAFYEAQLRLLRRPGPKVQGREIEGPVFLVTEIVEKMVSCN